MLLSADNYIGRLNYGVKPKISVATITVFNACSTSVNPAFYKFYCAMHCVKTNKRGNVLHHYADALWSYQITFFGNNSDKSKPIETKFNRQTQWHIGYKVQCSDFKAGARRPQVYPKNPKMGFLGRMTPFQKKSKIGSGRIYRDIESRFVIKFHGNRPLRSGRHENVRKMRLFGVILHRFGRNLTGRHRITWYTCGWRAPALESEHCIL